MKEPKRKSKPSDIELVPDAWPRFEKFITEIVKAGPQHRTAPAKSTTPKGIPAQSKKRQKPFGNAV
jgi:hypothetical protein